MGFFDFLFRRKPTPEKFAAIFMDYAKKHGFAQKMVFVPDQFQIRIEGDASHVLNLHNAYHDYCQAPRSRHDELLMKYTASLSLPQIAPTFALAKAHLMPSVRGRGQVEYIRLMTQMQDDASPFEDLSQAFSDDAVVMLVYDTEHSIATLLPGQLQDWGVDVPTAMAVALDNLRDRTSDRFTDLGDGVVMGEWGDAFDTARILLPDLAYRANVGSDPVMMIPTRGCFLLTAGNNALGQRKMVALANESIDNDGRFVSSGMYAIRDGKVVACQPQDEEAARLLGQLQRHSLSGDYHSQQELLDKLHQSKQLDIFVPTYQLLENKADQRLTSCCTWVKGVDSLLPKTDWVALVIPNDDPEKVVTKMLTWADVMAIGGNLLEEVEGYPVRYRVKGFPPEDKLAQAKEV